MNLFLFLLPLLVAVLQTKADQVYDVTTFGPINSVTMDITTALQRSWEAACASQTQSTVRIPFGTYAVREINLFGPCNNLVAIELKGTLKAPAHPAEMHDAESWISINNVDHFTLYGGGTLDGQGRVTWDLRIRNHMKMKQIPISIKFNNVSTSLVEDVTSIDSKHFHIGLLGCVDMTFRRVTIIAPGDSPNTDGIHLGFSSAINIEDSYIRTGDDCISIGHGSSNINIRGITCGPGHGISVGSMGNVPGEEPVIGVSVVNCTFHDTDNGVRIKTWPLPNSGTVTDLTFEDLVMDNVWHAVYIDQKYCPGKHCYKEDSRVQISGVNIKNIRGTTSRPSAIKLICSRSASCKNVMIQDIDLVYTGDQEQGPAISECSNVNPVVSGTQIPVICGKSASAASSLSEGDDGSSNSDDAWVHASLGDEPKVVQTMA